MNPFRWLVSCLPYSRRTVDGITRNVMDEIVRLRGQREREESRLQDAIDRVEQSRMDGIASLRREFYDLERRLCDAAVAEVNAARPPEAWRNAQEFQNVAGLYAGPEAAGMPTVDELTVPEPVRRHRLRAFLHAMWPFPRWIRAVRTLLSKVSETASDVADLKGSLMATLLADPVASPSHPSAREGDASDPYGSTESPGTKHPLMGLPIAPYDPNMRSGVERVDNPYLGNRETNFL